MTSLLASVALKGLLVLLLAALATRLLRKAPASARHGVWAAAFAALLLLPALALVGPQWTVGVLPAQTATVAPLAPTPPVPPSPPTPPAPPAPPVAPSPAKDAAAAAAVEAQMAAFEQEVAGFETQMAAFERQVEAEVAGEMAAFEQEMEAFAAEMEARAARDAVVASDAEWATLAATGRGLPPLGRWALALWAFGALAVALSWVGATLAARRIVAEAAPETDPEWGVLAERARRLSGIEGPVRLLRTDALDVPIAWGWGTPAVLLPASADEWDEGRREAVLLHEMAHLRRHDAWTQLVAQAALAVHWLNPLAWWGYRRFLDAREQACDDAVIQGGARPSDYAAHLVGVARALRREPHALAAVAPMARKACPLEERIVSILDADRRRGHLGRVTRAATVVFAAAVLLPLAALQPVAQTVDVAVAPVHAEVRVVAPVAPEPPTPPVAPVRADTTDEEEARREALREAEEGLAETRRKLRRSIVSMRQEEGEVARIRLLALEAAYEGLAEIDLGDLRVELRHSLGAADASLAEVDLEAVQRDVRRALDEAARGLAEMEASGALDLRIREAVEQARVGVDQMEAEAWRETQAEARREIERARRDLDRERERTRRELEEARREVEREQRELDREHRQREEAEDRRAPRPEANGWTSKEKASAQTAPGPSAPPSVWVPEGRMAPRLAPKPAPSRTGGTC